MFAAKQRREAVVRFLLDEKASVDVMADASGKTALMHAVQSGSFDIVRMFVTEFKAKVNLFDNKGRSALTCALHTLAECRVRSRLRGSRRRKNSSGGTRGRLLRQQQNLQFQYEMIRIVLFLLAQPDTVPAASESDTLVIHTCCYLYPHRRRRREERRTAIMNLLKPLLSSSVGGLIVEYDDQWHLHGKLFDTFSHMKRKHEQEQQQHEEKEETADVKQSSSSSSSWSFTYIPNNTTTTADISSIPTSSSSARVDGVEPDTR
mmetsp:Transcript_24555/g.34300  ORF Transcript_24555/g.34300 Transcript_24555/m.34300 type:complete len:262 (-) Transcript_24555:160-945(-)